MGDVLGALVSDVVTAVDLQDETVAEKEVDAVAGDPDLPPDRQLDPPQPRHNEGLQTRV